MKKTSLGLLALVLMASMCLYSCNSDSSDDDVTLSDNCAITNIRLGNLLRKVTVRRTKDGTDTTYNTTFYGGRYAMLVDQLNHVIYNPDSLPLGTNIKKVVLSQISADGVVAYRTEWGTDSIYASGDSLDFTKPRIFTCYSKSGKARQTYEVHVNVHSLNPEQFSWNEMPGNTGLRNVTAQKLFVKDGRLYDFAVDGGAACLFTAPAADGATWTRSSLSGFSSFSPQGIQMLSNRFYAVGDAGLMVSDDGTTWTAVTSNLTPDALVAAGSASLYAVKDGRIYASADGTTWTAESTDDAVAPLPAANSSSAWSALNFNNNFEYVLWGGTDKNGERALWKKTVDKTGVNADVWSCYTGTEEVTHPFPVLKSTVLLSYDAKMMAMGCLNDTVSLMYMSEDAGRSWESKTAYVHPFGLEAANIGCAVDADHYIWIVCGGTGVVMRGRLNRLGFATEQMSFQ